MSSATKFLFASLFFSLLSHPSPVAAQDVVYNSVHNTTSLLGLWSSGSGAVRTGSGFCNPVNNSFTYPATTGISYSFTTDVLSDGSAGYFEEAQYRFIGNGSQPTCITGVMQWQHGTYELVSNGSIILNPFAADGRQQVQDMCAAKSNILQQFNQTTLFLNWNIVQDPQRGTKLQIYEFDGTPMSPLYLISPTPNMLPTQLLTNTTVSAEAITISAASRPEAVGLFGAVGLAVIMGFVTLL